MSSVNGTSTASGLPFNTSSKSGLLVGEVVSIFIATTLDPVDPTYQHFLDISEKTTQQRKPSET